MEWLEKRNPEGEVHDRIVMQISFFKHVNIILTHCAISNVGENDRESHSKHSRNRYARKEPPEKLCFIIFLIIYLISNQIKSDYTI